jgi:[acyl-carrier-protein] S-malonyltransferase
MPATIPDDLVATVAGEPISSERVDRRLAELRRGPRARHIPPDGGGGSPDVRRWVVQQLVMEAVLAHEARAAGIADVASLVAHVTAEVAVSELDTHAYYDRNPDLYHHAAARTVRHVLVSDEATAVEAAARLVSEAGATQPGESQDVRRGELSGLLEDAIFAAEVGAVVGPIRTELGWHVARIEAATAPFVTPFEEARPAIEDELLVAARARGFDEWLEGRRAALVVVEPGFEHPGHPRHGVSSHRH